MCEEIKKLKKKIYIGKREGSEGRTRKGRGRRIRVMGDSMWKARRQY